MLKELKKQFMQIAFTTTILVTFLATFTLRNTTDNIVFFLHILCIATMVAAIFGVVYPYCWNYSTWKASTNIIITTLINFLGSYGSVCLFSKEMFQTIFPYWWEVLAVMLFLHVFTFYFYRKKQNEKIIDELNKLKKLAN